MAESSFSRLERHWQQQRQQLVVFARGLPAVLMIIITVICLGRAHRDRDHGLVRRHYQRRLQQVMQNQDWALAQLYSRKLSILEPNERAHRYYLALAVSGEGDETRALHLMESIAPRDQLGYGPAHWWLAEHWAATPEGNTRAGLMLQNWHTKQFLRSNPEHVDARIMLAKTEASLGNSAVAIDHLERVVARKQELHLVLARLSGRTGDEVGVIKHARQAVMAYQQRLSEQRDDLDAVLNLADAFALLEQPDEAARVIEESLRHHDNPQLRSGLVRLCLHSSDLLATHPRPVETLNQRLRLIEKALGLEPENRDTLKRLAQIVVETDGASARATELLNESLASGSAPAVVHMILGTHALGKKDLKTATLHFEAAHRLQPEFPACMNNLAWSLANSQPPQLLRAEQLASSAVELAPGRPEFHETRGQILLMQGRHREALPDLERGLQSGGDTSVTHASLAEVYEVLGQQDLAEKHRQKSASGK
ncbi:MAG: hypothetical protein R3B91_12380 [Planctomycetaceae bacterium]